MQIDISDEKFFNMLQQNSNDISDIKNKITNIAEGLDRKEKNCTEHRDSIKEIKDEVNTLNLWKASQEGIAGMLWKILPILIALFALIVTISRH